MLEKTSSEIKQQFEKRAFWEILAGMAASHVLANAGLKAAISTEKGQKVLNKIVNRKKQYNPIVEGLMDSFLGPEFTELHHEALKSKGITPKNNKLRKALRLGTSLAASAGTLASGVPLLGDLTAYNSVLKNIPNTVMPESVKNFIATNNLHRGMRHGNKFEAFKNAIIKSPVLGTIEEIGAKAKTGEPIKVPEFLRHKIKDSPNHIKLPKEYANKAEVALAIKKEEQFRKLPKFIRKSRILSKIIRAI